VIHIEIISAACIGGGIVRESATLAQSCSPVVPDGASLLGGVHEEDTLIFAGGVAPDAAASDTAIVLECALLEGGVRPVVDR